MTGVQTCALPIFKNHSKIYAEYGRREENKDKERRTYKYRKNTRTNNYTTRKKEEYKEQKRPPYKRPPYKTERITKQERTIKKEEKQRKQKKETGKKEEEKYTNAYQVLIENKGELKEYGNYRNREEAEEAGKDAIQQGITNLFKIKQTYKPESTLKAYMKRREIPWSCPDR